MQQAITSDAPVAATVSLTASAPVTLTADLAATLTGIRRGIEKEGIRATAAAILSDQPHPQALGAALTHPYITTDFAEAQLELITPAETDKQKTFAFLTALHHTVAKQLPEGRCCGAQVSHRVCRMSRRSPLPITASPTRGG
ncbi:glutamate-cysteine ligase [Photobacterium aphoticum]|uniref:Glutamate--cysteine ligase n=1 Tax=Photobacterium aphoticum TaxID=754436 RepID=A0A090QGE9_9GAMM|nr:glutamate-cysteine ligase [Photobacterium aphoticum]